MLTRQARVTPSKHIISFKRPQSGRPGEIFGIDIAIRNFVRAYFRHSRQQQLAFVTRTDESWEIVKQLAVEAGADQRDFARAEGDQLYLLECADTLFNPDPHINNWLWYRSNFRPGFPVCGLAHTMTGSAVCGVVSNYVVDPTTAADAIICPSYAIRDAIRNLMEIRIDFLSHRFGTKLSCPIQMPVIPLAIDTRRYVALGAPDKRQSQRTALGVAEDEVVILSFGRISHYTKAHPLPLFMGAERAARALQGTGRKLRLILMGFFSPPEIAPDYHRLAAELCPSLTVEFLSKDDPRFPDGLWAGADIFASLVDNYQESFGLTPIEAMAAGLPAVVTDWDGYRDGVRHGIDGFRIPTAAPPGGMGAYLVYLAYNGALQYGEQLTAFSQSVAVDIDRVAAAFELLARDPDLRRRMGESGRQRACSTYDWAQIIPAYEDLWDAQAARRVADGNHDLPKEWHAHHPSYPDYFAMFESFPSQTLQPESLLRVGSALDEFETLLSHPLNRLAAGYVMHVPAIVSLLVELLRVGQMTIAALEALARMQNPKLDSATIYRTVGWLLKLNILALNGLTVLLSPTDTDIETPAA